MYTGISYGAYFDTPQCRVSIDNVRMKFSYKYKKYDFQTHEAIPAIDQYSRMLDQLFYSEYDVVWHRCDFFKIGNYMRTCTISGLDSPAHLWSCAVMFGRYTFDNSCKLVAPEIVFDFNPNRVPKNAYSEILRRLLDGALQANIVRYDVAFDFPIPRGDITLLPNDRQCYRLFRDAQKGVTEYQGERSSHNALKLYDKTKEAGLSAPVTRCEITVGGEYNQPLEKLFPSLEVLGSFQTDMAFQELPFSVVACLTHPDMIPVLKSKVDRKTWRKYSELISAYGKHMVMPENWKSIDRFVSRQLSRLKEVIL